MVVSSVTINGVPLHFQDESEEESEEYFVSSEGEPSETSIIDLLDLDDAPEMEMPQEVRSDSSVLQLVGLHRETRSSSNLLPHARLQPETRRQSTVLPQARLQPRRRSTVLSRARLQPETRHQSTVLPQARLQPVTRRQSNVLPQATLQPETRRQRTVFPSSNVRIEPMWRRNTSPVRRKRENRSQSVALPPAIENMASEISKTMKHLQSLIQRRNAERASSKAPESSNSTACECPVCREPLYASSSCATLCGHVFHSACVHQLAEYHRGNTAPCPVCRATVHTGELLILRSGLPEAPASEESDSVDLTRKTPAEEKSELDHELSRNLKGLENLYTGKSVFQRGVAEARKHAQREVSEVKKELEKSKAHYSTQARLVHEDRVRVEKTISRIAQREEKLTALQEKYEQDLMDIAKKKSDLKVLEERMKVEKGEAEQKTMECNDMLEKVSDKEQRLDKLRQALEARKKSNDGKRSISTVVEDSRDAKKCKTQPTVSDTRHSQESPFSEKLSLPSAMSRPPPPRRPGSKKSSNPTLSLSAFVPKRAGIHRPSTGVAKRKK